VDCRAVICVDELPRFLEAIGRRRFPLNEDKNISTKLNIQILRHVVGNGIVKPDPEPLRTFKEFHLLPVVSRFSRVLEMFC